MHRILIIGLFVATSVLHAQDTAARGRIFREITFAPYDPIRLGAPVSRNSPAGELRGTDRIVLPRGFGGTDSITLRFDRSSRVVALDFAYPASTDYSKFIADYVSSLGPPLSREAVDSAGGRIERTRWEDPRTRFEIRRFVQHGRSLTLMSRLSDRVTRIP